MRVICRGQSGIRQLAAPFSKCWRIPSARFAIAALWLDYGLTGGFPEEVEYQADNCQPLCLKKM
jgi:hypothetical protein